MLGLPDLTITPKVHKESTHLILVLVPITTLHCSSHVDHPAHTRCALMVSVLNTSKRIDPLTMLLLRVYHRFMHSFVGSLSRMHPILGSGGPRILVSTGQASPRYRNPYHREATTPSFAGHQLPQSIATATSAVSTSFLLPLLPSSLSSSSSPQ